MTFADLSPSHFRAVALLGAALCLVAAVLILRRRWRPLPPLPNEPTPIVRPLRRDNATLPKAALRDAVDQPPPPARGMPMGGPGEPVDAPGRGPGAPGRGVRGSLADLTLATLLTVLEQERRSGVLTVWSGDSCGKVVYRGGRLVAASHEVRRCERDELALRRMLAMGAGAFSFEPGEVPGQGELGRSVGSVLLAAAQADDEARRPG